MQYRHANMRQEQDIREAMMSTFYQNGINEVTNDV